MIIDFRRKSEFFEIKDLCDVCVSSGIVIIYDAGC